MSKGKKLGFLFNLPWLKARRSLEEINNKYHTPDTVYELILKATNDIQLAEQVRSSLNTAQKVENKPEGSTMDFIQNMFGNEGLDIDAFNMEK